MNSREELDKFENRFNTYANYISSYSKLGKDTVASLLQKEDQFNKMTEAQRIEFINTDPDFQVLQNIMNKLYTAYASFYNFMNEGMKTSIPEGQPQSGSQK